MAFKTDGIVIREQTVGESDRLVWILTRDHGILKAFARKAKNLKDPKNASTGLLCYSDFSISEGKTSFYINNASVKDVFFGLRSDITRLSLAQYFCELAAEFVPENTDSEEFLRLILNSLHFLSNSGRSEKLIKSITELRMLSAAGYMPDLVACHKCGKYESHEMFFMPLDGTICCEDCYAPDKKVMIRLPFTVITAMRYICYSDFSKIYSFSLSEDAEKLLSFACESYVLNTIGHSLTTLDFYRSISN